MLKPKFFNSVVGTGKVKKNNNTVPVFFISISFLPQFKKCVKHISNAMNIF